MKLNTLQQKILTYLEPLPTESQDWATVGIIEQGKFRISATVTGILRSLRRGKPMIWDPWILKDDDVYRMFYLKGLEGQNPWWTVSNICGAVSTDMHQWQDLGSILEPDPANNWESGRICAGCTYKEDNIYYLFYSAGGKEEPHLKNEAIGLATSRDGLHFSRTSKNYLLKPDEDDPWYGRSNWTGHFHWRDPYIFKDDQTGNYYMFICASSKVPGNFQGCVGLAVADKVSGPYNLLPPAVEAPTNGEENWPYYHMERPQVIYKDGKYHLFFSCFKMLMNPKWLQELNHRRITNSSLYWYISDHITGPYKPVNNDEFIVKGSEKTGMYGTNFLQVSTPEEFIAYGWYHRLHALAVSQAFRVNWKNNVYPLGSVNCYQQQFNLDSLEISLSRRMLAK